MREPDPLERALRRVSLRVRAQRAVELGAVLALAGLGVVALGMCLVKLGHTPELGWRLVAFGAALPLAGFAIGALRPLTPLLCAPLLDTAYCLRGLCASAHAFRRLAPATHTPFMRACVERATITP